ncbi:hypothetical protein CY35_01G043300 [Sphagnum magellanicum]|nr:hypothetical protein CY35_01G043300 [Sphagnum magellanicum]
MYTGTDAIFCHKIWRFGFWICWEMQYQELDHMECHHHLARQQKWQRRL